MRDIKQEIKWGIMLARDFNVPPDDIDMISFFDCIENSLSQEDTRSDSDRAFLISPKTKKEEEAILGKYGPEILNRIFQCQYPFGEWFENYLQYRCSLGNDGDVRNIGRRPGGTGLSWDDVAKRCENDTVSDSDYYPEYDEEYDQD